MLVPLDTLGRICSVPPSWLPGAAGHPWCSLTCRCLTPVCACLHLAFFSLCLCVYVSNLLLSLRRTPVIGFIYLFLAVLGLRCCAQAFCSCGELGLLFVAVRGLLIAVAFLVVEHELQACGLQQLWYMGSVVVAHGLQSVGSLVVAHGLSCSVACGIFPDQGSNPCPLHWQADS